MPVVPMIERRNSLRGTALAMFLIAALLELAVIITAVVLINQHPAFDPTTHPRQLFGLMVLIGGSVQAAMLVAIGRIAIVVGASRPENPAFPALPPAGQVR